MPAAANITVKASDGTTDVVFTLKAPSGGDGTKATWYADALGGGLNANKPKFQCWSQSNGNRTARRFDAYFTFPYYVTNTDTSTTSVLANIPMNFTVTLPMSIPDTDVANAVAYLTNLLSSTLIKDSMKAGFSPT